MSEEEYLDYILKELQKKIVRMKKRIGDVSKDMEDMNDYFWENYNEFDEYGYEEYDNQTAYLMRSRERDENFKELKRYKKMTDSPYFGKIQFTYEGEQEPENFYIGIGNFWKESDMIPLIFDWRAPVSSLFYDYDRGPASYEAPSGTLFGEINQKMQFKIKHSKMIYAVEHDMKIDDDILRSALAGNADAKLKSIVTSIQKEQNAIIRNRKDKILVIQGCAGSGKTSIALHRIAYLLYHNRDTLKASNVLILSPNGIFADYISHILPELGEENISEMSFDDFAYHELKGFGEAEDIYDHLERLISLTARDLSLAEKYGERVRKKQSDRFAADIREYVLKLEYELMNFKDFKYRKIEKTADDIAEMFYEKFPDIPIMKRMESIAEYVIDEAETLAGRDFRPEEKEEILAGMNKMYGTVSLLELYQRFLQKYHYGHMDRKEQKILYEDVYSMLYMKYMLWGTKNLRPIKHLVIDEMQDYSYLHFLILEKLFHCSMTILGDEMQSMTEANHDIRKFLPEILGRDLKKIELCKSYRSTCEIMDFASKLVKKSYVIPFERHGEYPCIFKYKNQTEKYDALAEAIRKNTDAETIAVLTLDEETAVFAGTRLRERLENDVSVLDKNSVKFHTGIIITPYYLAKGLEFDYVFVADGENPVYQTVFGKQAMYVCATRALHCLNIFVSV